MKRFFSLIVALVLVVSMTITTYAQNSNVNITSASGKPEFVVENVSGKAGDRVNVKISVKNNPGITALQLKVKYSAKDLELASIKNGGLFDDAITHSKLDKNPIIISWYSSNSEDESANGCLATLKFKILNGAANSKISISYDEDNVFNSEFSNVKFNTTDGTVSVKSLVLGDVDGDGCVTIIDATVGQRYIAKRVKLTDEQMVCADTNKDGNINLKDITAIQRYIAKLIPKF